MIAIPTEDSLRRRIEVALTLFSVFDSYLIYYDLSERAITHKLAEYLQFTFQDWHVDCEYNRYGFKPKTTRLRNKNEDLEDSPVYPDIIVHRRGEPKNHRHPPHCLVVEARKGGCSKAKIHRDGEKVLSYLSAPLRYRYGMLIEFYLDVGGRAVWDYKLFRGRN